MELIIAETYEDLSRQSAEDVLHLMRGRTKSLICVASGDTPAGVYKVIVDKVKKGKEDISGWTFVGLDEWVGMNAGDDGSCRYNLNEQLFHPIGVEEHLISFFDGKATDLNKECTLVDNLIKNKGGIDVAILGLGMNGHIGMNEPGTSPALRSHVTALDPVTQKVGQKYFKKQQSLNEGITLGIASLLESSHIILLVSGAHKAEIVRKLLQEEISEQLPGSLLLKHPSLKIYLDKDAAKMIQAKP